MLEEHDLLASFIAACPLPTPADTAAWQEKYPALAGEIAEWARTLVQVSLPPVYEDDEERILIERASARGIAGLNFIHRQCSSSRSLRDLLETAQIDVPQLAREIGISRSILAYIEAGEFLPPVGKRLIKALSRALKVSLSDIEDALANSFHHPDFGLTNASETPSIQRPSYRSMVQASDMAPERKAYWLVEE